MGARALTTKKCPSSQGARPMRSRSSLPTPCRTGRHLSRRLADEVGQRQRSFVHRSCLQTGSCSTAEEASGQPSATKKDSCPLSGCENVFVRAVGSVLPAVGTVLPRHNLSYLRLRRRVHETGGGRGHRRGVNGHSTLTVLLANL